MKIYYWNHHGTAANPDYYKFGFPGGTIKIALAKFENLWFHGCDCCVTQTLIMWNPYKEREGFGTEDDAAIDCIRRIKLKKNVCMDDCRALHQIQLNIIKHTIRGA